MKSFFAAIGKVISFLPEEEEIISRYLQSKKYASGHFLVREDETSDRVFFIVSGLVKEYYMRSEDGTLHNEICTRFITENEFYYAIRSFVAGQPSVRYARALETTTTLSLSKTDLEELYARVSKVERLVRIITEQYQVLAEQRAELKLTEPHKQRYLSFLGSHQEVSTRLKIKDIASYLNMTPETLSRIRKEIR